VRIAHFVLDARLYQGESTAVYAGLREADSLPIAAKKVRGGAPALREELTFLRAAASSGVVRALDVVESDEGPVLLLERFGDQNLRQALNAGRMPLQRTLRVAHDLAQGLAAIHERRIVHRDLKPENILYDSRTDAVVIADFGIAAAVS
jgi:serine/threonine-protein kinase